MFELLLAVLDTIVRIIGIFVLICGVLVLFIFLWEIAQPEPKQDELDLPPDPRQDDLGRIFRAMRVREAMGLVTYIDYATAGGVIGGSVRERLGHCYELAGKAMLFTDANADSMPMPAALIHGSWHGPDAARRIEHAIVLLDTGQIWEPVTAGIYDRAKFESYTRWHRHQIYTAAEARHHMYTTGHYGTW